MHVRDITRVADTYLLYPFESRFANLCRIQHKTPLTDSFKQQTPKHNRLSEPKALPRWQESDQQSHMLHIQHEDHHPLSYRARVLPQKTYFTPP